MYEGITNYLKPVEISFYRLNDFKLVFGILFDHNNTSNHFLIQEKCFSLKANEPTWNHEL